MIQNEIEVLTPHSQSVFGINRFFILISVLKNHYMILCFDRLLFLQIKQVIVDDCTPTEVRGINPSNFIFAHWIWWVRWYWN